MLTAQTHNSAKKDHGLKLEHTSVRGLGIICQEGAKGTVEVIQVLPDSAASHANSFAESRLHKGDRIQKVIIEDAATHRPRVLPVNSPKKLAEALEHGVGGSIKLEVIGSDGKHRSVDLPGIKPASTIGLRGRQSECIELHSALIPGHKRSSGPAVEVTTVTSKFADAQLKIKESDRVVGMKIGKTYYDIKSPGDLEMAIGHMIPGQRFSVIVARYNSSLSTFNTVGLSAIAPVLSKQLERVGGNSARL